MSRGDWRDTDVVEGGLGVVDEALNCLLAHFEVLADGEFEEKAGYFDSLVLGAEMGLHEGERILEGLDGEESDIAILGLHGMADPVEDALGFVVGELSIFERLAGVAESHDGGFSDLDGIVADIGDEVGDDVWPFAAGELEGADGGDALRCGGDLHLRRRV